MVKIRNECVKDRAFMFPVVRINARASRYDERDSKLINASVKFDNISIRILSASHRDFIVVAVYFHCASRDCNAEHNAAIVIALRD